MGPADEGKETTFTPSPFLLTSPQWICVPPTKPRLQRRRSSQEVSQFTVQEWRNGNLKRDEVSSFLLLLLDRLCSEGIVGGDFAAAFLSSKTSASVSTKERRQAMSIMALELSDVNYIRDME